MVIKVPERSAFFLSSKYLIQSLILFLSKSQIRYWQGFLEGHLIEEGSFTYAKYIFYSK